MVENGSLLYLYTNIIFVFIFFTDVIVTNTNREITHSELRAGVSERVVE